jgi:hypothetical protein
MRIARLFSAPNYTRVFRLARLQTREPAATSRLDRSARIAAVHGVIEPGTKMMSKTPPT